MFESRGVSDLSGSVGCARQGYRSARRSVSRIGQRFFEPRPLSLQPTKRKPGLILMEMQRHPMMMYTSCGWFFGDLSGIETVQVILYSARVIQLAQQLFDVNLEPAFLERLEAAESNLPKFGNGRAIYLRFARPAIVDLPRVGAHYAVSSLFEELRRPKRDLLL